MGVGAMVASPVYGFAFSLAAIPAAAAIFLKPLAGWPKTAKSIVWWSVIGVGALVVSAQLQGEQTSGNILHYAAMALFVTAAVKLTNGQAPAAQLLGYASIGSALFYVLFRPANTDTFEHMWKYGVGPYVATVAVWFLCTLTQRRSVPMAALFLIGCASLFLGFRSHGLVCFAVVVIIMIRGSSSRPASKTFKGLLGAVALWGLSELLPKAIESGLFGDAVRNRTIAQLGDTGPALLAGRVEPPLSIAAIAERPWLGWGNLNAIGDDTMSAGADIAYSLGMVPADFMNLWVRKDGRVSVHSLLGEGWVEGGLPAAVMPILLIVLFAVAIFKASGSWAPLVVLVSIQGIWDVLFSTWGYNRALTLALSAVLAAWAISKSYSQTAHVLDSSYVGGYVDDEHELGQGAGAGHHRGGSAARPRRRTLEPQTARATSGERVRLTSAPPPTP
ncbi:hypothetical protein M1D89_07365 [Arthrobacter sp. D3-18]